MPREERAKQFAPFDAVSGFRELLKLKEYEHERELKGDVSVEQIEEISSVLKEIKKGDKVKVLYFADGYKREIRGEVRLNILEGKLEVGGVFIDFDNILSIAKF